MRAVVFATAGHIDHGKTSLVAALTGVWCDRLKEEKERGITLVLGFAPLPDPQGEVEVSFVDVPGHERLVHTMLAGVGGVDKALLVVAADEGIMPQTREHVAILRLLGVRGGVVALTKTDKVSPAQLAMRQKELRSFLADGPLAGCPVLPCSAVTGEGIPQLREAILREARQHGRQQEPHRPFRLAADRVFTLPGVGTVVTGTARWGRIKAGEEVWVFPPGKHFRIRSLQVHSQGREEAFAGERVALALAGAKVEEIPRGAQVLTPGPWEPSHRLLAEVTLLEEGPGLEEGKLLWLFLLAARVACRVERLFPNPAPGGSQARALLRLAQPLFLAPGDVVVLRQPSPPLTLGGGPVLSAHPPRLSRKGASQLASFPRPWENLKVLLLRWITEGGPNGIAYSKLAGRLGVLPEGLQAPLGSLQASGAVVLVGQRDPRVLTSQAVEATGERALELLRQAGLQGLASAQLFQQLGVEESPALRAHYLQQWKLSGRVKEEGGHLLAAEGQGLPDPLALTLEELYLRSGFAAPSPQEAAQLVQAHPKRTQEALALLLRRGSLVRLGGKWLVHRQALDGLVASLRQWGKESFGIGEFKERFGLTRKLAIPILEWLDSQRITRREGDRRRLTAGARDKRRAGPPADPRP